MSSESPASPWHAVVETFVRTSPITVGTGASALGGIPPSLTLFLGLGVLTLGANICVPVSKAIGDGLAYRVKRRLEGVSPGPPSEDESL